MGMSAMILYLSRRVLKSLLLTNELKLLTVHINGRTKFLRPSGPMTDRSEDSLISLSPETLSV